MSTAVGLLFFASVGASSAAEPPGNPVQDVSAVDQYVEALPTSSGPAPTGKGAAKPRPLSAGVASQVREQGGDDVETLIEIATSPKYAAPRSVDVKLKDPPRLGDQSETANTQPSALNAVVSPVAEADEERLLLLFGILGGSTIVAASALARQRRS